LFRVFGVALTTLLLPGMHGTSRLFDRLVVEMPDTIEPRVVTYPTDEVLGYAQLLARIELPAGPFAIVAESYSGPLAIRIAAARSANVCGLVLVASFARSPRPAIPRWAARLVGSWRPAVSAARIRDVHCVDVRGDFRRIAAPILYLRGSRDRVVPPRVADELKSLRPDMELVTLDAPHAVLQRRPVESATAIARFLLEKSRSGPASTCAAWRDVIVAKVEAGLSAERIHQDLGAEHEFTGSDWSVRRFVRRLKETRELPVRRIETAAGEEAQVDFEMGIFESRRRSEESGSRDNEDRVFSGMARAFDGCSPHGDGRFAPRTNEREISRRTHDAAHAQNVRQEKSPGDRWSPGSWAWFPGGAASSGSPWRSRWSRSCCRFRPRAGARRTQSFSRCSCANSVRRSLSVRYWRRSFTRSRHSEESARRRVF
jgi:pimeloyl-ACP methyl ester carboxylesterase